MGVKDSWAEFAWLRLFYREGEDVELMAAIGLLNYFNRFNNLLRRSAHSLRAQRSLPAV